MIRIGPYTLLSNVVLAPMAGVTDRPFRELCRDHGAALAGSEMVSSDIRLWHSEKSRMRRRHDGERSPRVVQIAGADPEIMAQAARLNVAEGAQIIDINMGCPAKKVLKKAAGSALLRDEKLVARILSAVTAAVEVPVTLKIRTGWDPGHRNAPTIARIAEDCGIEALAVHGRTRACAFKGPVEYDTIAAVKETVSIPVLANGDIDTPQKAARVLAHTGADGVMIGRGAQGRPWIFSNTARFLADGSLPQSPSLARHRKIILNHLRELYNFYGNAKGVLIARKHCGWYLRSFPGSGPFRKTFNAFEHPGQQLQAIREFFSRQPDRELFLQSEGVAA